MAMSFNYTTDYDDKCALYIKNKSSENIFHFQNTYGGIPQNLVTNLIVILILVVLFILLRKSAWKVVNKIVKKDEVDRWTHIFFSFTSNIGDQLMRKERVTPETQYVVTQENEVRASEDGENDLIRVSHESSDEDRTDNGSPANDVIENGGEPTDPPRRVQTQAEMERRQQRISRTLSITEEMSFGQWLGSIFTLGDEDIYDKCGNDALQYIRFQRHVICYLLVITVLSVSIILPLNFQGDLQGDETSFEHTTLVNLNANSDYLWVHVCLAFLYFPLAILIMRRYSVGLHFQEVSLEISKTLMLDSVPRAMCNNDEELRKHFDEAFPDAKISDIRFAYNVSKLQSIHLSLHDAKLAQDYCRRNDTLGRSSFKVYPYQCSRCCSCFCCCCVNKLEANDFYNDEVTRLTQEFNKEKEAALKAPLGIVFVTFKSVNMAKDVYDAFRRSMLECSFQPPTSSVSSLLKPEQWKVSFAPTPDDLYWENLSMSRRYLTLKKIIINIALFFVAFFLTTPEYLVSQTNSIVPLLAGGLELPSWIVDFLPTLLLWSFTALLPLLVAYSDRWLGHWTRSSENHSIMKKTFWYLLFMVILLPTLGFTTASASIQFIFGTSKNETYRWECIFLPDSGAFFVNYVITAALTGAGLELIRFPELFFYAIQICWSKSKADTPAIQLAIRYEFRFGEQYARMMLLFCMTIMFSVSCPLITPFGTLYFITKHYVDRHNLLYVNKPSKVNKKMHATAISFVVLSTVVLQFFMTVFLVLRSGNISDLELKSKFAIGFFLVSVNVFSAQLWSETCKKFSAIEYIECTYIREDQNASSGSVGAIYLPDILKEDSDHLAEKLKRKKISGENSTNSRASIRQILLETDDDNATSDSSHYGTFSSQSSLKHLEP